MPPLGRKSTGVADDPIVLDDSDDDNATSQRQPPRQARVAFPAPVVNRPNQSTKPTRPGHKNKDKGKGRAPPPDSDDYSTSSLDLGTRMDKDLDEILSPKKKKVSKPVGGVSHPSSSVPGPSQSGSSTIRRDKGKAKQSVNTMVSSDDDEPVVSPPRRKLTAPMSSGRRHTQHGSNGASVRNQVSDADSESEQGTRTQPAGSSSKSLANNAFVSTQASGSWSRPEPLIAPKPKPLQVKLNFSPTNSNVTVEGGVRRDKSFAPGSWQNPEPLVVRSRPSKANDPSDDTHGHGGDAEVTKAEPSFQHEWQAGDSLEDGRLEPSKKRKNPIDDSAALKRKKTVARKTTAGRPPKQAIRTPEPEGNRPQPMRTDVATVSPQTPRVRTAPSWNVAPPGNSQKLPRPPSQGPPAPSFAPALGGTEHHAPAASVPASELPSSLSELPDGSLFGDDEPPDLPPLAEADDPPLDNGSGKDVAAPAASAENGFSNQGDDGERGISADIPGDNLGSIVPLPNGRIRSTPQLDGASTPNGKPKQVVTRAVPVANGHPTGEDTTPEAQEEVEEDVEEDVDESALQATLHLSDDEDIDIDIPDFVPYTPNRNKTPRVSRVNGSVNNEDATSDQDATSNQDDTSDKVGDSAPDIGGESGVSSDREDIEDQQVRGTAPTEESVTQHVGDPIQNGEKGAPQDDLDIQHVINIAESESSLGSLGSLGQGQFCMQLPDDGEIRLDSRLSTPDPEPIIVITEEEFDKALDASQNYGPLDVEALLSHKPGLPPSSSSAWFEPKRHQPPARMTDEPVPEGRRLKGTRREDVDTALITELNKDNQRLLRAMRPDVGRMLFSAYIGQQAQEGEAASDIRVVNEVDKPGGPPDFEFAYTDEMIYSEDVPEPELGLGCDCEGDCDPHSTTCSCVKRQKSYFYDLNHSGFAYYSDETVKQEDCSIWECGPNCGCPPSCRNRVIQRGRDKSIKLELFKTARKGWGVRAKSPLRRGQFLGIYAGELISEAECERRGRLYGQIGRTYVFDLDGWHIRNPPIGLEAIDKRAGELARRVGIRARAATLRSGIKDGEEYNYSAYSVDAFHYGYTRYLNHSCDPNLVIVQAYVRDFHPERPLLVIFARRDIRDDEELCISYKGIPQDDLVPQGPGPNKADGGSRRTKTSGMVHVSPRADKVGVSVGGDVCVCGARNCDGRMFI